MQLLSISPGTTLISLSNQVGARNVPAILNANALERKPDIGREFINTVSKTLKNVPKADKQRKISILNTLTSDSDIFETAALLSEDGWRQLSSTGTMPGMLRIPETIKLTDSTNIIGNGIPVAKTIYNKAVDMLKDNNSIDPVIFNEYSSRRNSQILNIEGVTNPIQWFKLPWGQITLFSSLDGGSMDFPVFPDEVSDGVRANYDTMPDMIYQYEPWQVYKSSGPRSNTYEFHMHRDMWSGDHRDGKCNELIRFCEANCYPEYQGAAVVTSSVVLYIAGQPHIAGIITEVKTSWMGPIGLDNFYLECKLQISITEVSPQPISYSSIRAKRLAH